MFCPKCGKQIADNAAFCPGCGAAMNAQAAQAAPVYQQQAPVYQQQQQAPMYQQPMYQQQAPMYQQPMYQQAPIATAPAQPSAFGLAFSSFLNILKGMFSKNVVKTVGDQAKNTGLEWVFGMVLSVLAFAFAMPVNMLEGITQIIKSAAGGVAGSMVMKYLKFPFFPLFGTSLLVSVVTLGAVALGLWLLTKVVAKQTVPFTCVLNVVATATLPLSLCYIANMLLGLIWVPLAIVVSVVALFMTMILLYAGFQKLEKPVSAPFYPFTIFVAAVVVISLLLSYLVYGGVLGDWFGNLAGSALGGLDSLF